MIHTIILCIVFWALGAIFGYYTAKLESLPQSPPARVRFSYVDTTPPSCVFQPTRDKRHVCEWERARQQ